MKKLVILFTLMGVLLVGCTQEEKIYNLWMDSSLQSEESIDSAIVRLNKAGIDFIIDDKGNVFVNEKEMDKAVMCCS